MSSDDLDALLAILQRALEPVKNRAKRRRQLRIAYLAGIGAAGASAGLYLLPASPLLLLVLALAASVVIGAYEILKLLLAREKIVAADARDAVRRMAELGDVRAIGPLLDADVSIGAAAHEAVKLKAEVGKALDRLLPQVRDGDRFLLTDKQLRELHWYLDSLARVVKQSDGSAHWTADLGVARTRGSRCSLSEIPDHYIDFLIDIGKALEHIGNATSVPCLERIANLGAPTSNLIRLQEAADESLRALRQRLERERTGKTLLRPAVEPDTRESSLLRPAQDSPTADPQQLLRPADHE